MTGPFQVRGMLRHATLSTLATVYKVTGQMSEALQRKRVQFFYLHDLPKSDIASFRTLLATLNKTHQFLSYSEAVNRVLDGNIDKPYLSLSFDDGLRSCLDAAEVLSEFGIKGCFFICADVPGETDKAKLKAFCVDNLHTSPKEFLTWTHIESLLKSGHEIGSHTASHRNLATLPWSEVESEIAGSFETLKRQTGQVKHFAWPYGRFENFSAEAARLVFESGFVSCASAVRGCHVEAASDQKALCIRRDNTVVSWPQGHVLYFMARNSQLATRQDNEWPMQWQSVRKQPAAA